MNGRRPMSMPMQPDRRPQELARMLAMQERNSSLNSPVPQQPMRPSLAYAGATPNTASGVPPQAMNFNGPQMSPQPGMGGMAMEGIPGRAGGAMMPRPQMGPPQISTAARRTATPGMTTPQGGRYRGDFDNE